MNKVPDMWIEESVPGVSFAICETTCTCGAEENDGQLPEGQMLYCWRCLGLVATGVSLPELDQPA
jgi:hypothetical protein